MQQAHLQDVAVSYADIERLYRQPLFDLLEQARAAYHSCWGDQQIQLCTLLSIKTGGCSEDCAYCAQSARYQTGVKPTPLMPVAEVVGVARRARDQGATRFCMGAAWKGVRENTSQFEEVLEIVRQVSKLGIEVCVTLGQVSPAAAKALKAAGLHTYNHNLDTSPEFYPQIVGSHTFEDRLNTVRAVQEAGLTLCCGGIIGLGETEEDRLRMLEVLAQFRPPPESVPINCLMPQAGTPLDGNPPVDVFQLVRLIATTRLLFPEAKVRLSAGRTTLSREAQALCFFAGANSIFFGDKLLTADNPGADADRQLLADLGLAPQSVPTASPTASHSASTRSPAGRAGR